MFSVINTKTGKFLDDTQDATWSGSIEKYRKNYKNSRVVVMYAEGLDIVQCDDLTHLKERQKDD